MAKLVKMVVVDGKQFKVGKTFVNGGTVVEVPEGHLSRNLRPPFVGELEGSMAKTKPSTKKRNQSDTE